MDFLVELEVVARSLTVPSPTCFTVLGKRYDVPANDDPLESDSAVTAALRSRFGDVLYSVLHCRLDVDGDGAPRWSDWAGARDFAFRLSLANGGTGTWQWGWVVRGVEPDGRIVVERHGVRFWIPPNAFRPAEGPVQAGVLGRVRVSKEYRELIPGFYMALGNADDRADQASLVRLYWHVRSAGAEHLTARLTRAFNEADLPFRFKVLSDPVDYQRADAAVLYLPREHVESAMTLVRDLHAGVRGFLRESVSAFAKKLARGLAIAEDPGTGDSFGRDRSRALARALTTPAAVHAGSTGARLDAVLASLCEAGLDPDAMHLNPDSVDGYEPIDIEATVAA